MRFAFIVFITLILSGHVYAERSIEIGWEDLEPKGLDFYDPFEELTEDQMYNLALVAEFRDAEASISEKDRASQAFKNIEMDYRDAIKFLEKEGIDIDGLLAQRQEITEKRRLRAMTPNEDINGKQVRIPGYLLPLEFTEKEVTEFLLVPWVGACIHTPPPPAVQIIHVKVDKGIDLDGNMYAPVWVDGQIAIEFSNPELDFVDGVQNIEVGYKIEGGTVEDYDEE